MAVAWAEPVTIDVFANTRYSDNINKRETNSEDDFEHRAGMGISKSTDPGACQGALNGDVAFVTYQNDTNSDDISAAINANGVCEPNRNVRWRARDTLTEVRTTTRAPDAPGNRELRNVFATGPTFTVYPNRTNNLSLDLEYQITRFEDSTSEDSDRITTTGRWTHLFSQRLDGGLAVSRSSVELREDEEEITRDNANLFFSWRRLNGEWSGEAGYSWLESEQGALVNETDGFTGRLRYSHQWEAGTSGFLEAERSLTDVSSDLDIRIPGLELNLTETSAVTVTAFTAGLNQRWTARTSSDLTLSSTESEYERSGITEERLSTSIGVNHRITPLLSGRVSGGYAREDFGDNNDRVETVRGRLGLSYQRTRDLSFSASAGHEMRISDLGISTEYHENWVQLGVRYNLR